MSTETNKAAARRIFEDVFNTGRTEQIGAYATPDLIVHYSDTSDTIHGLDAYLQALDASRHVFGEMYFVIEDQFAEGDRVATRWTMRAVHQGEYMGVPATGRPVTLAGISIYRFTDGKVAEGWVNSDDLGLLRQIGA
jgi:steroid delta-isomerase-like uncharacterized protein